MDLCFFKSPILHFSPIIHSTALNWENRTEGTFSFFNASATPDKLRPLLGDGTTVVYVCNSDLVPPFVQSNQMSEAALKLN